MGKLSLSLIFVVVLGVVSLGWGISRYYSTYADQQIDQHDPMFQTYYQLGKTLALTLPDKEDQQAFLRAWGTNEKLALSLVHKDDLALPNALTARLATGDSVTLESDSHLSFYFVIENTHQVFILEVEKPPVSDGKTLRLILTLAFYLGIITIISIWLYPLIRRLQRLRKTAVEFGSGNLSVRLNLSRYSYISDIEREFNHMADRIRSLVDDNKLLSRAVSHDLKTPLARLRFGFETLVETKNEEQREKYHARIESDLDEMETLVETLLQYARMDEASISIQRVPIDLTMLVTGIAEKFTHERNFSINSTGNCTIFGDEKYLKMLVHNLLINAVEHSDRQVRVSLEENSEEVTFAVEDDGIGVSPEKRHLIIKPFVKGDELKTFGKKGHGMGLAIVHRVAEWHGANLIIEDSIQLQGACFRVVFPNISA